jgi:hypothetical protein
MTDQQAAQIARRDADRAFYARLMQENNTLGCGF